MPFFRGNVRLHLGYICLHILKKTESEWKHALFALKSLNSTLHHTRN